MESFLCILSLPIAYTALTKSSKTTVRCQERFNEYCTVNAAGGAQKAQQEEDRTTRMEHQLQNAVLISYNKCKLHKE